MSDYLKNQVAVVTGAGGTLCRPIALHLAAGGARVVLIGRSADKLQPVAEEIEKAGGSALVAAADVTCEAAMRDIADRTAALWGPCRFLINGAGGNQPRAVTALDRFDPAELDTESGGFFNLDPACFNSVLQTNTLGTVIPCRVFGRQMAAQQRGAIINFASMNSYRPLTRVPAYAMAKAAIVNFTAYLANYLAPANIRVNAIAPGFFVNERSRKILTTPDGQLTERGQNVMHHTPLKRFGEAPELLGCVDYLLNDHTAGFVTGITIPVDGGFQAAAGV